MALVRVVLLAMAALRRRCAAAEVGRCAWRGEGTASSRGFGGPTQPRTRRGPPAVAGSRAQPELLQAAGLCTLEAHQSASASALPLPPAQHGILHSACPRAFRALASASPPSRCACRACGCCVPAPGCSFCSPCPCLVASALACNSLSSYPRTTAHSHNLPPPPAALQGAAARARVLHVACSALHLHHHLHLHPHHPASTASTAATHAPAHP